MSALLATPNEPQAPAKAAKRRISKRVSDAIDLLIYGNARTIQDAAKQVGLTRQHLSESLSRPDVKELRNRRLEQATEHLESMSLGTLHHLLASANSERVRAEIAMKVLARRFTPEGHALVNIAISPGYVVDLSGGRVTPHHETIEANALETLADVGANDVQREESGGNDGVEHEPGAD